LGRKRDRILADIEEAAKEDKISKEKTGDSNLYGKTK